ncbi:MAG: HEAT repeat domain-containing protein [Candidatus Hatepunaea meridiana]|nr:HEAT repeat domain-containing protein [Candidatus Hatepunaea meridiana]
MKKLYALIIILLLLSCGKPSEPLYEGMPLKTWVKRLESPEREVREDALKVITKIGKPAIATEPYLRKIANNDPSSEIRVRAIEALEKMDLPVVEYQTFLEEYNSPIIPVSEEDELKELAREIEGEDQDLLRHASGDDDLEYLKAWGEGTLGKERHGDTIKMPKDSAEFAKWLQDRKGEAVDNLLNQLKNPKMLALLLKMGNKVERNFAALRLGQLEGEDNDILEALQQALGDSSDQVSEAAEEAIKKWMPE